MERPDQSYVQLCGQFVVELRGRRVEQRLPSRQGRCLFAYLVLRRPRAVGRDELSDANEEYLNELEAEMLAAAENLEFERAAALRDRILQIRSSQGGGPARPIASAQATSAKAKAKSKARAGGGRKPKTQ